MSNFLMLHSILSTIKLKSYAVVAIYPKCIGLRQLCTAEQKNSR